MTIKDNDLSHLIYTLYDIKRSGVNLKRALSQESNYSVGDALDDILQILGENIPNS